MSGTETPVHQDGQAIAVPTDGLATLGHGDAIMHGLSADDMPMFDAEGEGSVRLVGPRSCAHFDRAIHKAHTPPASAA